MKTNKPPRDKRRGYSGIKSLKIPEITTFSPEEVEAYEDRLKTYRDLKNSLDTAFEEGVKQGLKLSVEKSIKKVAMNGLRKGIKEELILELTGLTPEQLAHLKEKMNRTE
ncbi:MAG: hypothetical protein AAF399_06010 [Bacteroidota bacterium]